jgi:hypothetical protein
MWKNFRTRGSKEHLNLFDASPPISFYKPFNTGVIALQEEFMEARENPMKCLLEERIKQMRRQHLGVRPEGRDLEVKKKITKVKIAIPFFFYINEFRIDDGALFVCKIPKFKVHFKHDNSCIYVSEENTPGFFEAEVYAIEKRKKVMENHGFTEHLMVPFYDTDNGRILLMKLEDYKKTGSNAPRLVGCWEVVLDESIQDIYMKYARDTLKMENLLIQFPVAMVFEQNCHFAMYWNEFKRETEAQKVNTRSQEILRSAGYLERSYVQRDTNPSSSEGNKERDSAAEQEQ